MKTLLPLPLAVLCLVLGSVPAQAMMLRCGNQIISEGDPMAKVIGTCGEPASISRSVILRAGIPRWQARGLTRAQSWLVQRELLVHQRSVVEVPVETWVYNQGPNKLMREVVFEQGRVVNLRSLGYGYRE